MNQLVICYILSDPLQYPIRSRFENGPNRNILAITNQKNLTQQWSQCIPTAIDQRLASTGKWNLTSGKNERSAASNQLIEVLVILLQRGRCGPRLQN
jgi:hypothetical protein